MNPLFLKISLYSFTACILVRISKWPLIKAFSYLEHKLATAYSIAALDPKLHQGGGRAPVRGLTLTLDMID